MYVACMKQNLWDFDITKEKAYDWTNGLHHKRELNKTSKPEFLLELKNKWPSSQVIQWYFTGIWQANHKLSRVLQFKSMTSS